MSIFWKGYCCCGDTPCVHTDDFSTRNISFAVGTYGVSSTPDFTHVANINFPENGYITLTNNASGTLTIPVKPTGDPISAKTEISVFPSETGLYGNSGLSIGGAVLPGRLTYWFSVEDSVNKMGKWQLWQDFGNDVGNRVLLWESGLVHVALGITLEIVVTVVSSGIVDVQCYADESLVHTENNVAFEVPEVLEVGLAGQNYGKWEYLQISPCPPEGCTALWWCADARVPFSWVLEATVPPNAGGDCPAPNDSKNFCELFSGTFAMMNPSSVVVWYPDYGWVYLGGSAGSNLCYWLSAVSGGPAYNILGNPLPLPPNGAFAAWLFNESCDTDKIHTSQPSIHSGTTHVNPTWQLNVKGDNLGTDFDPIPAVFLEAYIDYGGPSSPAPVVYRSDPVLLGTDLTTGSHTLNLHDEGTVICDVPASITVTAGTSGSDGQKVVTDCNDILCDPPLDVNKLYQLITDDGSSNIGCGAIDAVFNGVTFSWEWHWVMHAGGDSPHGYACPNLNELNFTAALTCYEKSEGAGKKWHLDFGGDVTGSMEWDVANQDAGGLVDICGTADVAFAALASECVPEDHPLAGCVDDASSSALCCLENVPITLLGDCCSCLDVCEKNITGSPVVGEPGIIEALWPFAYPEDAVTLRIDCSGSATVLDSSGVAVSPNPIESVTWDSAAISATVEVTDDVCCPETRQSLIAEGSGSGCEGGASGCAGATTSLVWHEAGSYWEGPYPKALPGDSSAVNPQLRIQCGSDGMGGQAYHASVWDNGGSGPQLTDYGVIETTSCTPLHLVVEPNGTPFLCCGGAETETISITDAP